MGTRKVGEMMYKAVFGLIFGVFFGGVATAQSLSGYILAGQSAYQSNDFEAALDHLAPAIKRDTQNPRLRAMMMQSQIAVGDLQGAAKSALRLTTDDSDLPIVHLIRLSDAFADQDFGRAIKILDQGPVSGVALDNLMRGWAHVGKGQFKKAIKIFDAVIEEGGTGNLAVLQKAYAYALVGDLDKALEMVNAAGGPRLTGRAAQAYGQIKALQAGVEGAEYTFISNASEAAGELLFQVAVILEHSEEALLVLSYTQMASALAPRNYDAVLMAADLLTDLSNPIMAARTLDKVPSDNPLYPSAALEQAKAMENIGDVNAARSELAALAGAYPDLRHVQMEYGNFLRRHDDWDQALQVYLHISDTLDGGQSKDWYIYFVRGITYERLDQWQQAEQDLRQSVALNPNQGAVLNYLGYSLVEMEINVEEGLDLIIRADAASPDQGHIIDSLGWAYFKLGRYDLAVQELERAVEFLPVDPIVNDHLGDAYWKVGRKFEAHFQWRRALSFDPETDVAATIRLKLENGLEAQNDL
ncbi:MAG: tetratricopeptide repeat protein [Planktomarina sp.]